MARTCIERTSRPIGSWALAIVAGLMLSASAAAQEAASAELIERGRILFMEEAGDGLGCQACHGEDAKGLIGPDIRGKVPVLIRAAMEGVPDMMDVIDLNDDDIKAVSAYLQTLPMD